MQLLMDGTTYLAKTQYGEWAAKQAGFTWDKQRKVWWSAETRWRR
jgi:hypothetical protein